jgi:acyl carrier protein
MVRTAFALWAMALTAPAAMTLSACKSEHSESKLAVSVKQVIAKQATTRPDALSNSARLQADVGLDDLDIVEVIMALEEKFNLSIDDQDALKMKTVGDVIAYVEKVKS